MRQCVTCKKDLGEYEFVLCQSCNFKDRMEQAMTMVRSWRFNLELSKECNDQEMIDECTKELAEARAHLKQVQRELV